MTDSVPYADVFSLLGQPIDIEGSFYNMSPRKRSPEYPIECSPRSKESKASMENSPFSPYLSEITTDTVFHPSSPESGVDMLSSTTRASFSSHTSLSFSPVLRNNTEMKLLLDEQPERNYRPRYESEGLRAPIKGRSGRQSCPAVKIVGAPVHTTGKVKVELVQVDSCELYPGCHLQGDVEKDSGTLPDKALRFDGLRIQRQIIQAQNGMSNSNRKAAKARTSDKARLMFEAKLETVNGPATLLAFSEAISLEPAHGPGHLKVVVPETGGVNGGELIVILGHKLQPPTVVEFSGNFNGEEWKEEAELCRDEFQPASNAILAKVPQLPHMISEPTVVLIKVFSGKQRTESSNHLSFTYQPTGYCGKCSNGAITSVISTIESGVEILNQKSFIQHASPLPNECYSASSMSYTTAPNKSPSGLDYGILPQSGSPSSHSFHEPFSQTSPTSGWNEDSAVFHIDETQMSFPQPNPSGSNPLHPYVAPQDLQPSIPNGLYASFSEILGSSTQQQ